MGRPRKGTVDPATAARADAALRMAKAMEAVNAARAMVMAMRHTPIKGHYLIPPAAVLRLCVAVDDVPAVEVAKGGE